MHSIQAKTLTLGQGFRSTARNISVPVTSNLLLSRAWEHRLDTRDVYPLLSTAWEHRLDTRDLALKLRMSEAIQDPTAALKLRMSEALQDKLSQALAAIQLEVKEERKQNEKLKLSLERLSINNEILRCEILSERPSNKSEP
jgi:hypothetical protein